jgi:4-oxalocrotonate tautomerase
VIEGKPAEYRQSVGDVILSGDGRSPQGSGERPLSGDRTARGHSLRFRSSFSLASNCILVQLTLAAGRTIEQKRGLYKKVVDDLHKSAGRAW